MAIHSFLKAEKGDPDWQFSPECYFGKNFKLIDASTVELKEDTSETLVLRQNPTEKELLAKQIKISLQKNSNLDLIIVNEADEELQQIFLYDINIKTGSALHFGIFVKNGKFNKHIIQVNLEDEAVFHSYGLMMNDVEGDTEIISKVVQQNPSSHSHQLIYGIAGENSQTVYQGMSIVHKESEYSENNIDNINLISGDKGRCYSKPDIYVDADNIKTSQTSSVELLDAEKIYFLQTRGVSYEMAKNLLVSNFQKRAIDLLSYTDIQEEIRQIFQT